jgi:hypothetical protein
LGRPIFSTYDLRFASKKKALRLGKNSAIGRFTTTVQPNKSFLVTFFQKSNGLLRYLRAYIRKNLRKLPLIHFKAILGGQAPKCGLAQSGPQSLVAI